MDGNFQQATLSDRARLCQLSFDQCLARFVCVSPQSRAAIEDQLGRFSIWAANNGLFAPARASLDYRLREAEDVQRLVMGLLRTLDESIQKCIDGARPLEGTESPVPPAPSFDSAVGEIAEQISLLHQISNMIRRASSKRHNVMAATSFVLRDEQGDDYGPRFRNLFALAMIRHSFPHCSQSIQDRLADAMLLRRKRILYRHSRYAQSPLRGATSETRITQPTHTKSQLEAQRHPETGSGVAEPKDLRVSSPAQSVAKSQAITATTLDMGHWKEVSAAPSVGSQATTIQLSNDHTFTFPAAPKKPLIQRLEDMKSRHLANLDQELDSLPNYDLYKQHLPLEPEALEELIGSIKELTAKTSMIIDNDRMSCEAGSMDVTCPYCCCIISSATAMDRNKWAIHIKHDIDPYICLFEDCDAPDALYSRSHSWLEHMRRHRNHYRCSARSHGPLVFKTQSKYESHMTESHKLPKAQLRLLVERQSQSSRPVFESCPLCGIAEPTGRLESHIASHLVYLALKSLPAFGDDGDSEDSDDISSYSNTTVPQTVDSAEGYDEPGQELGDRRVANGSDAANQLVTDVISILTKLPVPTLDGFTDQIRQLNPRLAPALVDRFAIEQVRRYTRLLNAQHMHANVAAQRTCGSESFCLAQGGRSIQLPLRIIDPGAETDDADIADPSQLAGLTLDAGQFPPGIPLPPNVRRLPAKLECQFCFKVKNVQKPGDWTKHIIEDLQPYTCSFPECQDYKSFKRKADWIRHESERHRKLEWWECERVDCRHICYRKENYIQHLVREHRMPEPKMMKSGRNGSNDVSGTREKAELWEAVERGHRETTRKPSEEPCRFCGNISTNWKNLTVHLAKHLEQIAMPVFGLVNPSSATSEDSARLG